MKITADNLRKEIFHEMFADEKEIDFCKFREVWRLWAFSEIFKDQLKGIYPGK